MNPTLLRFVGFAKFRVISLCTCQLAALSIKTYRLGHTPVSVLEPELLPPLSIREDIAMYANKAIFCRRDYDSGLVAFCYWGFYRGYIGIMENKMETTIVY